MASCSSGAGRYWPAKVISSWAFLVASGFSREEKLTPSGESPTSANVTSPLPVTNGRTSYSTHVPAAIAPALADGALVWFGPFDHVMAVSVHELVAPYTAGPLLLASSDTYTRSFAACTVPAMPVGANRRNASNGLLPPTT